MQAITVAITPAGVQFFAQTVLDPQLSNDLSGLTPQSQTINIGTINENSYDMYVDIVVKLTGKNVTNFHPQFQSVTQGTNGTFALVMTADNFHANYDWHEAGSEIRSTDRTAVNVPYSNDFNYSPTVSSLTVTVNLAFQYQSNAWRITVPSTSSHANVPGQVPSHSVTHSLPGTCGETEAEEAVKRAIESVDFESSIQQLIPRLLDSIPASGNLTPNIVFTFGLGDSGLTFPNDSGIAIGATGQSTWKSQAYPGTVPPALPVPAPPTDGHHLQMYVGNYALNGLYWAFFQDGRLTSTIQASDLPDPSVLKVATYTSLLPALKPYATRAMQAQIQPLQAPTVAFQTVYVLSTSVMNLLQTQLPTTVYNDLTGLSGNAYTTTTALEADLATAGIDSQYVATIEKAAKATGAVNTHDLQFTLTILDEPDPAPYFEFSVNRTDILQNLGLGIANSAQTLQFAFLKASDSATFITSNIPQFEGAMFGPIIWPIAGEPRYDQLLQTLGQTGVPLPIMQGFKFDFTEAVLSIQEGYVSILSNVQFTS